MKNQLIKIDTSFARAASILLPQVERTHIILVGCGGTGSWLAPSIARLAAVSKEAGKPLKITFIDGDTVESGNIPRQNFCEAEVGLNKAVTLANRYGLAWGLEVSAIPKFLTGHTRIVDPSKLTIVVGCVDRAAARKEIAGLLKLGVQSVREGEPPHVWWLDAGNSNESGQILLGSTPSADAMKGAFVSKKTCIKLPSPALQSPDLLKPKAEELTNNNMSCAELMMANMQSLAVNQRVAAEAADYLMRMVMGLPLKRFATQMDLISGSATADAITPEAIAVICKKSVEFLKK
jgi:PRTRC genetic system ThiF family protein